MCLLFCFYFISGFVLCSVLSCGFIPDFYPHSEELGACWCPILMKRRCYLTFGLEQQTCGQSAVAATRDQRPVIVSVFPFLGNVMRSWFRETGGSSAHFATGGAVTQPTFVPPRPPRASFLVDHRCLPGANPSGAGANRGRTVLRHTALLAPTVVADNHFPFC